VLRVISSMATRHLLTELGSAFSAASPGAEVSVISMGGVDAAKRVAAGEPCDAVVLASGALDQLITQGHVLAGSRVDVVNSSMAVAVRTGDRRPAIDTEDAVRQTILTAARIGYSTGPSGNHMLALLEQWGIMAAVKEKLVQAPPGIPVASLVARGDVTVGFQQLSELLNVEGVDVLGLLPAALQGTTTFSAGVARASTDAARARELLAFMASPATAAIKRQHGMEPPG
jgi:molybdate transport system substrate-binding protein